MCGVGDPRTASEPAAASLPRPSPYQRSIRIARNKARALDNYGNFFARRGEFTEAIAQYRQALEVDPDYELAQRHLRLALQKASEQAEETEES